MSTIKIPLMIEVFEQIKAGKFKLSDKYTFQSADLRGGTGVIRSLEPGAVLTVKDLITLMIIVSDNTATDVLYKMVGGPDAVNRRMEALGLKITRAQTFAAALVRGAAIGAFDRGFLPRGPASVRAEHTEGDGLAARKMEHGALVDKPSSDLMLQAMRGQLYRTRIPRYVTGLRIPHKTGDFLPYVGDDVGMLEAPGKTIVVSIFTGNHFGSGRDARECDWASGQRSG